MVATTTATVRLAVFTVLVVLAVQVLGVRNQHKPGKARAGKLDELNLNGNLDFVGLDLGGIMCKVRAAFFVHNAIHCILNGGGFIPFFAKHSRWTRIKTVGERHFFSFFFFLLSSKR
jgi:hypothetical protein